MRYDVPIDTVPESIAIIPVLGTILPIAWALDGDVHLPVVDGTLLECLDELKQAHGALYPDVQFRGRLHAGRVTEGNVDRTNGTSEGNGEPGNILLFSGGVDSVASFLHHRDSPTRLASVWGADIRLWDQRNWAVASAGLQQVAGRFRVPWHSIRTNFREFVRYGMLNRRFRSELGNWWTAVQHGFGLLSLCAPLAAATGSRRVLIPATRILRTPNGLRWSCKRGGSCINADDRNPSIDSE